MTCCVIDDVAAVGVVAGTLEQAFELAVLKPGACIHVVAAGWDAVDEARRVVSERGLWGRIHVHHASIAAVLRRALRASA